jgi:hypothetical protein
MTAPAALDPHVTGEQTLLDAALPAAVGVHIGGAPPGATPPYLVLYFDAGAVHGLVGDELLGTLGDRHRDLLTEFQVTAVGATAQQAQELASQARVVVLTQQPTVAGRVVSPAWQVPGGPRVAPDYDLTPPLFYLPVIYQRRSGPAS